MKSYRNIKDRLDAITTSSDTKTCEELTSDLEELASITYDLLEILQDLEYRFDNKLSI